MSEAAIVGGGLAGGAAATLLARAGHRVRLFERESEPVDKVCGEFLSSEAQRALAGLGLDLDRLGATRIATVRLAHGRRTIAAPLPFVARGLTRKRLDAALLEQAEAAGALVHRGIAVRSIEGDRIETGLGEVAPKLLLLASGKHEVRGATRDVAGCETGYVGFKSYWQLPPAARSSLEGKVDVILFDGGYAGLQMVEDSLANLCLLVTKARLAELGGTWAGVLDAVLREPHAAILRDAEPRSPRPLAIAGVPYGFLHRGREAETIFRLGDQAAVIPSFCGEGMSIALYSARIAAAVIRGGGGAAEHRATLAKALGPRLRLALALQRGGQRAWSRPMLWAALSLWPGLTGPLVRLTRVPA